MSKGHRWSFPLIAIVEGLEVEVVVREVFQRVLVRVETSLVEEADIIYVRLTLEVNTILIIAVVNFV